MVTMARAQQRVSLSLIDIRLRLVMPRTAALTGPYLVLPLPAGGIRIVVTSILKFPSGSKD